MSKDIFQERSMGKYDNVTGMQELLKDNSELQEVYAKHGSSFVWFFDGKKGDGVESLKTMKRRVRRGLKALEKEYGDMPVILVAHAGIIKMIRMLYEHPTANMRQYLSSYVPANGEVYKVA